MKALVIYYSLNGNTDFIAHSIVEAINADAVRIHPVKDLDPLRFIKYFKGLYQILSGYQPVLKKLEKDPTKYDILFIGTPTWWGNIVPAVNSFLDSFTLKNKKIALFVCCDGGPNKITEKLSRKVLENEIIGKQIFFKVRKNKKDQGLQAAAWAKDLLHALYYHR